ncbi:CsbD family protein [Sinisalibacter lacisalsi]|nr:CsbD family protein [Sinisalibacter lacisalsi]
MDKDRIKGTVKKAKGAIKESIGKASDDSSLEAEGKIEKAEGALQTAFGKAKDALRKS